MIEYSQTKKGERPRCRAIVQPGEYTIDWWDGKRCSESNPYLITKCPGCGIVLCLMIHWTKHLDSVPIEHFEKATE
jgi:hypothetical protein